MVRAIEDLSEFRKALKEAGDKLVVVDFTATWCGPCKMIAPFFKSLSEEYTDIVFLKVDVDEAQDVAQECGIKCMPTFYFFRNGEKIADFSGANQEKLKESILKYR